MFFINELLVLPHFAMKRSHTRLADFLMNQTIVEVYLYGTTKFD